MSRTEGWHRTVSTRGKSCEQDGGLAPQCLHGEQTDGAEGGECGNGLGQIRVEIDTVLHRDAFAPISCTYSNVSTCIWKGVCAHS